MINYFCVCATLYVCMVATFLEVKKSRNDIVKSMEN